MAKRYLYIRAWHITGASHQWYIDDLVAKAAKAGVPETVIYEIYADDGTGPTGKWADKSEITDPILLERIESTVRTLEKNLG